MAPAEDSLRKASAGQMGGIAGIASLAGYLLAVALPWPETQTGRSLSLLVVSGFPIFGIVYSYGLWSFIAEERESTANRLGFVFAVAAFATLLAMLVVQVAVVAAVPEIARGLDARTAEALRRGLRMVDLGLDVAWDLLIGTGLIFSGVALCRRSGFGPGWGVPSVLFGILLIGLNAATFPWPPNTRGLFDIGPFIAVFLVALSTRLLILGRRGETPRIPPGEEQM